MPLLECDPVCLDDEHRRVYLVTKDIQIYHGNRTGWARGHVHIFGKCAQLCPTLMSGILSGVLLQMYVPDKKAYAQMGMAAPEPQPSLMWLFISVVAISSCLLIFILRHFITNQKTTFCEPLRYMSAKLGLCWTIREKLAGKGAHGNVEKGTFAEHEPLVT